ncbi:hypothetical protein STPH1_3041 [Streptomyces sp. OM5714]|nr:hypothetical protein STPH1_3041 [Streptomyces sp. OM5714]
MRQGGSWAVSGRLHFPEGTALLQAERRDAHHYQGSQMDSQRCYGAYYVGGDRPRPLLHDLGCFGLCVLQRFGRPYSCALLWRKIAQRSMHRQAIGDQVAEVRDVYVRRLSLPGTLRGRSRLPSDLSTCGSYVVAYHDVEVGTGIANSGRRIEGFRECGLYHVLCGQSGFWQALVGQ